MMWTQALAAAALLGLSVAQTTTDCDPTKKSCPPDPALGTSAMFNFNSTPSYDLWEEVVRGITYDPNQGAIFSIKNQGDAPTLRSRFYMLFGRCEIHMKTSPGTGIVSSVMWLSDDRDEIDWEMLGPHPDQATTNYFSRGVEDYTHGKVHNLTTSVQADYHNYTTIWTKERLDWYIDGAIVRTLIAKDANDTQTYPQTPMRLSFGLWAAGDPRVAAGTREWAGGNTDYSKGPFSMAVKSVQMEDYSKGKEYVWSDTSGLWPSIKVVEGNSTAVESLNTTPPKSTAEKWAEMPTGAKAGIYAGGGVVGAALVGTLIWYYIRQRRIGAAEAKKAEEDAAREREEISQLQRAGINPDSFAEHGQEYGAVARPGTSPGSRPGTSGAESFDSVAREKQEAWAAYPAAYGPRSPPHGKGPARGDASPTQQFDFGAPPPAAANNPRAQSPAMGPGGMQPPMRSQSQAIPMAQGGYPRTQMRSATTDGAYGRMGSPGPQQGYGQRPTMHSPAPMRPDVAYSVQRMESPGPMRPEQQFGVQRMQSPGPQGPPGRSYTGGSQHSQRHYGGNGY